MLHGVVVRTLGYPSGGPGLDSLIDLDAHLLLFLFLLVCIHASPVILVSLPFMIGGLYTNHVPLKGQSGKEPTTIVEPTVYKNLFLH